MSTRGAVGFKIDGKYLCSYNHSDSYPEGLGIQMLELFIKITRENGWDTFKENARKVTLVVDDEKVFVPAKFVKKYRAFSDYGVGNPSTDKTRTWYQVLRDVQGQPGLLAIYNGLLEHMIDSTDFMKDSLFCEYAYTFNLDEDTFECWRGFQQQSQKGNPFGEKANSKSSGSEYYPVALVGKISLKDSVKMFEHLITNGSASDSMLALLKSFYPDED